MRVRVHTTPEGEALRVLIHYKKIVQGFIYRHLDPDVATFFHDVGLSDEFSGRKLKLFTFSRLIPARGWKKNTGVLKLYGEISLIVASPIDPFIESFVSNVLKNTWPFWENKPYTYPKCWWKRFLHIRENIMVETLSPVTVYSTIVEGDPPRKKPFTMSHHPTTFNVS